MARALGRYELLRPLARGGMAEVYLARRRAAGIEKWLVVKRMRPERSGDPRFLDLFVREARLSMSLVHQNIVPVFDFGRIDDQVFLAMERVEGKDLGSSLARAADHRLPPLLAAFVAAECCQALDYAHQRKSPDGVALGIVHRDVTPRNVLLSWSGEVKLTDFGIAALAGEATSRLLGTPQYMAPEQARSEPIDPRADIYAIGLVLREAVSGVRPRPGADRDAILDAARRGELVPWSAGAPAVPADPELALGSGDHSEPPPTAADRAPRAPAALPPTLVAIIDRATGTAAADRYPDARSMLEDLDTFIVAERSARKGESPARQLGAWLAGVWQDERDDAEGDAAIDGEHLVSFLDDGAPDVIGTGTERSLAATAADDAPGEPHAGAAPVAPVAASPSPSPSAAGEVAAPLPKAVAPPPGSRAESPTRLTRISSSNSIVASGSFHTIPTPDELGRGARPGSPRPRRFAPLAGIALAAIAGAAVWWIASGARDRAPDTAALVGEPATAGQAVSAQPNGPSTSAQPNTAQPNAGPSTSAQSNTAQPNTAQPAAGPSTSAQPTSGQPTNGQPASAQPSAGSATGAQPAGAQSSARQPTSAQPSAGSPAAGQPASAQSSAAQRTSGPSASGPPTSAQPSAGPPTGEPRTGGPSRTGSTPRQPDAAGATATGHGHAGSAGTGHPATGPSDDPTRAHSGGDGSGSAADGGSSAPPRPATCKVRINLTPWAYYTVDDDTTRHETPGTIDLTPGPHRLHVWNPELHVARDITLDVPADRDAMNYSEPLQPTSLPLDAGARR